MQLSEAEQMHFALGIAFCLVHIFKSSQSLEKAKVKGVPTRYRLQRVRRF